MTENQTKKTMNKRKRWFIYLFVILLILVQQIPLPYYYSQPGEASSLKEMITVEEGYEEEGEFYLTTIRQRRANIPLYLWAQFSPYRELIPREHYLRENETDEQYFHRQTLLMKSAQVAAKIVAYEAAKKEYHVDYRGIRVTQVIEGMDAANHLQEGDLIQQVDGKEVKTVEEMNEQLEKKERGEEVIILLERNGEMVKERVMIDVFPEDIDETGRTGLGISFPVTERDVTFNPDVTIEAGSIGGPSAGLMFSLEIYNQLTATDWTHGLKIAGTGSIDEEGNVGRIGGVEQKVIAADQAQMDVFFAPDDEFSPSNYEQAVKTAEAIETDMEIVPVTHFNEALHYLKTYPKKTGSK